MCADSIPLGDWLDQYGAHLERTPLARSTRESYVGGARLGIELMGLDATAHDELAGLSSEHAGSWLRAARDRGWTPSTKRARLRGLREFLQFVRDRGGTVPRIEDLIVVQAAPSEPRRYLGESGALALIAATRGRRDRALVRLMWESGGLASEVLTRTWLHLSAEQGTIEFDTNARGGRIVPLSPVLVRRLLSLRPARDSNDTLIFKSRTGGPLDRHRLHRIVADASRRAELSAVANPRDIRHGRAIRWLEEGRSGWQTAALLGHRSVNLMSAYRNLLLSPAPSRVCIHPVGPDLPPELDPAGSPNS